MIQKVYRGYLQTLKGFCDLESISKVTVPRYVKTA